MASKVKADRSSQDRVKRWFERLKAADKVYEKWHDRFHPDRLEQYWEGRQWQGRGITEADAEKLYTINLFFASMESQKPALLFNRPQFKVTPKPGRGDDLGSTATAQAQLCEDTLQTFVDDRDVKFALETGLALQDAFFRYGVVEVGYSADYLDNPHAGKPVLKTDTDGNETDEPMTDGEGQPVMQPDRLVTEEHLFVKRIPAKQFRVSLSQKNDLTANDWCGYYEWVYLEDVKRNPNYHNTTNLHATGTVESSLRTTAADEKDEIERHHGMCKLWKVYDLRRRVRHVLVEGHAKPLQEDKPWKALPFAVLKFHERLDSFLPLPPTYNWVSPQDEWNETREQQKVHRQRFNRRYTTKTGNIEDGELDKLIHGGDGTVAKSNVDGPLLAVPDAPLDGAVWTQLSATQNDFAMVSGISGESRNVAAGDTATQASIMEGRQQIRESTGRELVGGWLGEIGRLMLLTIRERMALDLWIKRNVDPGVPNNPEAERVAVLWQKIQASELGEMDVDVSVDLASLSPVTQEGQRAEWMQMLALLANPGLTMLLGSSDVLLKKTLALYGIRQQAEVAEIQKVATLVGQMLSAQAGARAQPGVTSLAGAPGKPGAGGPPKPMQPFQTGGIDPQAMLASLGAGGPQ